MTQGVASEGDLFDCHVHAWDAGAALDRARLHTPTRHHSDDDVAALWAAHGIAGGVLVQPSFFGTDNAALLRLLARDPGRRRGVVCIDPRVQRSDLPRWHAAGVRAIRFNTVSAAALPDFTALGWPPLLAGIAALGWHIEVTAHAAAWPCLLPSLLRTNLRICVDHWGWPGSDAEAEAGWSCLIEARRSADLWIKLSAPYRVATRDLDGRLSRLLDAGGPAHLVWGSDWPFLRHESATSYTHELHAARHRLERTGAWRAVAGDNPRELYGW